jgi:hypothetical protein
VSGDRPCRPRRVFPLPLPLLVLVPLLLLAAAGFAGCRGRSGPPGPVVSGTVWYGSRPLPGGDIRLTSPAGDLSASGSVDAAGRFRLVFRTPRPLPAGSYRVAVASWVERPGLERPDGSFSEGEPAIPLRFRDHATSGLAVDIESKPSQTVTVRIPE